MAAQPTARSLPWTPILAVWTPQNQLSDDVVDDHVVVKVRSSERLAIQRTGWIHAQPAVNTMFAEGMTTRGSGWLPKHLAANW
eukprot:CAMPEP_0202843270 /NCGR_PEP_ID=MMETSP1389-20130828/63765_1 /ASSEMBLY_ACC=CAM_ASM_000865 /TAXON_ID=302021 /ORGANISM="Rhodomonas sp., Strain CCMP768" /LENGTH=82 /DNA_ID=CAMNT_0049520381 /DNA_START=18 /DNA_END=263 /DNA_ORIENTATION=+